LLLTDVEPGELAVGTQVELEIGLEIAPAIAVKRAIYIQAIIVDPIDARKAFMTDGIVGEAGETARTAIIGQPCVRGDERQSCRLITGLQCFDRTAHLRIAQLP
jgi:hypothetical protein